MRLVTVLIILVCAANVTMECVARPISTYQTLERDVKTQFSVIDNKLSQGHTAPVATEDSVIFADRYGVLHSFDKSDTRVLNWKMDHVHGKKIISMSLAHHMHHPFYKDYVFFIVNNIVYAVSSKTGDLYWQKELHAPMRGSAVIINNNLVVLTIDNNLHVFDIKDGGSIWSYQHGITDARGLYFVSPVVFDNMIIAPFSNGDLVAFNEEGKILWSQKLPVNPLDTQLTDITTTPQSDLRSSIMIATNNSCIYGINIESGGIIWSKPLRVKSISNIQSNYSPLIPSDKQRDGGRIYLITQDNKIMGLDISSGAIVHVFNITEDVELSFISLYAHTLWVVGSKGVLYTFPGLADEAKLISIPKNVLHVPIFNGNYIYITSNGNGAYSLNNRFVLYD